ncbi:unnamed protein product [Phaedon cochleariae]|uniref:Equilibrative nucleoside transporter n=1 Tax=Phaedon cochleariae TaxID=80249 RepID=A0A9P0DVW8_PHACE|nr:unnamed protein product [Phaedon cochleariae]
MDHIIAKRESLLSIETTRKSLGISSITSKSEPKDAFYICRILFMFIGFMHLMPILFLGSAANYWFYKFRNTTLDTVDPEVRTDLQTLYQSSSTVAQTLPSLGFMFLTTIFGHKFQPKYLTAGTLVCLIGIFSIFAIFTQVDTDNWQTAFFFTTMFLLVVNSAVVAIFQLSTLVIIAKFPNDYMKSFLFGQSGGIVSNIILVISISVTDYQPTSAAIYFIAGVIMIAITFVLFLMALFTEPYRVYVVESTETGDTGTRKISWSESKEVLKCIWPSSVLFVFLMLAISCIHPAVDTLVVSEFQGDGTVWTEKYFVPVITYLLADVSGVLGRFFSTSYRITKTNYLYWIIGGVIRCVVCVTFIIFCNAQPRHLPVIFNHDWEYILFNIIFPFSNGFLFNVGFLSLNELSEGKSEVALKLSSVIIAVSSSVFSANGILMVKLL